MLTTPLAAELRRAWLPAKVEQAVQVEEHLVALRLRTLQGSAWLYLSWHPVVGHLALSERGPERGALAEAFSFGAQLNTLLHGLVLTDVQLPHRWERVVQLSLAQRPAEPPLISLMVEVMGRYSNLVVVDGSGGVLAAGHQVGSKMSSLRLVQSGRPYAPPPLPPGIDPDACGTFEEWRETIVLAAQAVAGSPKASGTVVDGIVRGFRGSSPSLGRELCLAAAVEPLAAPADLSPQDWARLHEQWEIWLQRVESADFACSSSPCGAYSMLGAYPAAHASALLFLSTYYSRYQQGDDFERAKARVQRSVAGAVARLRKKIGSLRQQGANPESHLATQRLGDLLMANLYAIPRGAAEAVVEDWDAPGATVAIPLDPLKPAVAAAEALYAKARKQRRAVDQVAPLILEAESQLEYLLEAEVMVAQLAGHADAAALREVEADLVAGKYVKPPPGAALAAKAATKAKRATKRSGAQGGGADGYRQFESPGGLTVLVGRNSRQNDELTMRKAQPTDVWMHARGVPGAHLLLRVPAGRDAGDADLQFAANIAAFFSKSRTEGKVDITCARPADISKPRGAKLGQVLVKKEFVIIGKPGQSPPAVEGGAA